MAYIEHYLPEFMQEIEEIKKIMTSLDAEFDRLYEYRDSVYTASFFDIADSEACERWETMLGITSAASLSLEERRALITLRLKSELPYTNLSLRRKLNEICGEDGYTYKLVGYSLEIRVALDKKVKYDEVRKMLASMLPANILLTYDLLYNTHRIIRSGQYTHEELGELTHKQIREEVI